MLNALGWKAADDAMYAESVTIRQINDCALNGAFRLEEARRALLELTQPWAIKDTRFVGTIGLWMPVVAEFNQHWSGW